LGFRSKTLVILLLLRVLCVVVLWVFALRVVSLELESTHLLVVYHVLFPSLIKGAIPGLQG